MDAPNSGRIPARLPTFPPIGIDTREGLISTAKKVITIDDQGGADSHAVDLFASLPLEMSLVHWDYVLFSQLLKEVPELKTGLSQLEQKVRENQATRGLEVLCSAGCDRVLLLWLLHWLSDEPIFSMFATWLYKPGVESIQGLFATSTKQLSKLIRQANEFAGEVERINRNFEFGVLLEDKFLRKFHELPRLVREYGALLQYGARHFGRGSHIYHNIAKARLTTYVKHVTRRFHDKEVAALISSVMGDEKYDETSHRVWRSKQYPRLKEVDPALTSR